MQELFKFIQEAEVLNFMLLFARISGLMFFFPFFKSINIPIPIKTMITLYLTFTFFPNVHTIDVPINPSFLIIAVLSELLIGFISGIILEVVFSAIGLAGMQISNIMGFSMASVMDPQSGISTPMISSFLTLLATTILLSFNGDHYMLLLLNKTINNIPLGTFYPNKELLYYILKATSTMFLLGFTLAFPVIALSLLSDLIFGMLMKTMPQFNLLVVGFPIKIALSFMVLVATLGSLMFIFKKEWLVNIKYLLTFF